MINMEEISKKLKKNFEKFQDVRRWQEKNIEKIIQVSYQYSQILQDESIFHGLYEYISEFEFIGQPENAKNLHEHLLKYSLQVLNDQKDRKLLALIIRSFVQIIPNGREKAKSIISNHIRSKATANILAASVSPKFAPYVASSQILSGEQITYQLPEIKMALSCLIAVQNQPSLLNECGGLIEKNIVNLPVDEVVKTATSSNEAMKFVLSAIVPHLINKNLTAFEIIQKLSISACPEPAKIVARELKAKRGIDCFL